MRFVATIGLLIAASATLTGCASTDSQGGAGTAPRAVDIGRLASLRDSLRDDFTADSQPTYRLEQSAVDAMTADARALIVTPPECAAITSASVAPAGTAVNAIALSNAEAGFVVTASQSPQPTTDPPQMASCRNYTAEAPDGTATLFDVVDAPSIDGATTRGMHSIITIDAPVTGDVHAVDQYVYTARLDDRNQVSVRSSANPRDTKAVAAQAKDLLTKAVAAVRWDPDR